MRQVLRNALTAIAALASALIIGVALYRAFSLLWSLFIVPLVACECGYFALTLARRIRAGGIAV
jgi:hypothetical protein